MKHERATAETRESAALYALGALTYHKGKSFELHLNEGCLLCEEELQKFRRSAADLGLATQEIIPPDYLRELLASRIEREHQTAIEPISAAAPEAEKQTPNPPPAFLSSLNKPEKKGSGIFAWILVVALAIISGTSVYKWKAEKDSNSQMKAKIEAKDSEQSKATSALGAFEQKAAKLENIESIIARPGTKLARIIELGPAETHHGVAFFNPKEGQCILVGNLPAPPEGKEYQAWYALSLTNKISAGTVKVDASGAVFEKFDIPKEAASASIIVVSLEPLGGSQQPTPPFYAIAKLN